MYLNLKCFFVSFSLFFRITNLIQCVCATSTYWHGNEQLTVFITLYTVYFYFWFGFVYIFLLLLRSSDVFFFITHQHWRRCGCGCWVRYFLFSVLDFFHFCVFVMSNVRTNDWVVAYFRFLFTVMFECSNVEVKADHRTTYNTQQNSVTMNDAM